MEIWLARSEPYMSASEQALLLLEALSSGDVSIFLSGKPLALFIRKDGVQQIQTFSDFIILPIFTSASQKLFLCTEAGTARMARASVTPSYDTKHYVTR